MAKTPVPTPADAIDTRLVTKLPDILWDTGLSANYFEIRHL